MTNTEFAFSEMNFKHSGLQDDQADEVNLVPVKSEACQINHRYHRSAHALESIQSSN